MCHLYFFSYNYYLLFYKFISLYIIKQIASFLLLNWEKNSCEKRVFFPRKKRNILLCWEFSSADFARIKLSIRQKKTLSTQAAAGKADSEMRVFFCAVERKMLRSEKISSRLFRRSRGERSDKKEGAEGKKAYWEKFSDNRRKKQKNFPFCIASFILNKKLSKNLR